MNTKEEIEEAFLIFIDELIKQKTWNEKTKNSFIEAFSRIPSFIDNNLFCQLDNLKIENKNEKILYLNQLDNFKQDFEEKSSFIIKYIVNIENKL